MSSFFSVGSVIFAHLFSLSLQLSHGPNAAIKRFAALTVAPNDARAALLRVADRAGFVDLFAGEPNVGGCGF